MATYLDPPIRRIVLRAWLWNLFHLGSAVVSRFKFGFAHNPLWELLEPFWGQFQTSVPNNLINHPDLTRARPVLIMDGKSDADQLNFGWYGPEKDGATAFRWSAGVASALFRISKPVLSCTLAFLGSATERDTHVMVRALGSLEPIEEARVPLSGTGWRWQTLPVHLPAGSYEVLLQCEDLLADVSGRKLGVAVSSIRFE